MVKTKFDFCREHLKGLINAIKCLNIQSEHCHHDKCEQYKDLKLHIEKCPIYKNDNNNKCTYKLCYVGKILLAHLDKCNDNSCKLCIDIKLKKRPEDDDEMVKKMRDILSKFSHAKSCLERRGKECFESECGKYIKFLNHFQDCTCEENKKDICRNLRDIYIHSTICAENLCKICPKSKNDNSVSIDSGPSSIAIARASNIAIAGPSNINITRPINIVAAEASSIVDVGQPDTLSPNLNCCNNIQLNINKEHPVLSDTESNPNSFDMELLFSNLEDPIFNEMYSNEINEEYKRLTNQLGTQQSTRDLPSYSPAPEPNSLIYSHDEKL